VFVDVALLSTEKVAPNTWDTAAFQSFAACEITTEFSFVLGTGITYPVMYGPNGNWPIGLINLDQYGTGSRAAFYVIPEPSAFAFFGVGAAATLLFRRKSLHKQSTL
jgi:hypothetical protein